MNNETVLTIHADGRITVGEHLRPTETAAEVLRIMREQWMADIQSKKIREQQDRIKRLEEAGDSLYEGWIGYGFTKDKHLAAWLKAREAKL